MSSKVKVKRFKETYNRRSISKDTNLSVGRQRPRPASLASKKDEFI